MIDVKQIIDVAQKAASVEIKEIGGVPLAFINGQAIVPIEALKIGDERAATPRALKGTARLARLESFTAHVNRFKDEASAIFADPDAHLLVAIHDYSASADAPRWARHRSVYEAPLSRQWKAWIPKSDDGITLSQDALADFLELNAIDLASDKERADLPKAAQLIAMARSLVVNTKGNFERTINATTGEYTMLNKLEHETTSTKIYPRFLIGIPVFEGGDPYALEVTLRFALSGGRPSFTLLFPTAKQVFEDAFKDICEKAAAETGLPLFWGKSEQ